MKILAALLLLGLSTSAAAETIQGRWKLTAAEDLRADGSVARYPWGRHPVGSIVVGSGWCYLQIMSSDIPTFSAGNPSLGEQMKAALLSTYIAYRALHGQRVRWKPDAEGRGGVAARLRWDRAEAILPLRERQDVLRAGA